MRARTGRRGLFFSLLVAVCAVALGVLASPADAARQAKIEGIPVTGIADLCDEQIFRLPEPLGPAPFPVSALNPAEGAFERVLPAGAITRDRLPFPFNVAPIDDRPMSVGFDDDEDDREEALDGDNDD